MSIAMRAAKREAEVMIYDGIGADFWGDGVTAKGFAKELNALGDVEKITVRLNSGGGDVFDGIAIYEALARHKATKTVVVDGLAASIASVIAMAGDEIRIAPAGFIMIHNAWTMTAGDPKELRRTADLLESVSKQMAGIYVSRTRNAEAKVLGWMDEETWFTADDAIGAGFADAKTNDAVKVAASIDARRFGKVPPALAARIKNNVLKVGGIAPDATPRLDAARARIAATRR